MVAVQKNGDPVEDLVFEDEGHGFVKRENRIKASETHLKFLNTHLAPLVVLLSAQWQSSAMY